MIVFDDTTLAYRHGGEAATVFSGLTLRVDRGEWVALSGGNGSGKTTLLRAIASLVPVAGGTLEVGDGDDKPVVTMVLQDPDNQLVAHSVAAELDLSVADGFTGDERDVIVSKAAERFGLEHLLDRNPHEISGGEKQRLALATVWLQQPDVLLLDEPVSFLDVEGVAVCAAFVGELHGGGVTVVWATHGGEETELAGRVVALDGGVVVFDGKPSQWREHAGDSTGALADRLGLQNDNPVTSRAIADAVASRGRVAARSGDPAVITMDAVSHAYGKQRSLAGVTASFHAGETVGLIGPNAAGKSTLLLLIGGVLAPDAGTIKREWEKVSGDGVQNVFFLPQSAERLFFAETVEEEVAFGLRRLGLAPDQVKRRVRDALDSAGLPADEFVSRSPFELSVGEMRRLAFAIAAALDPRVLLLDEPTAGLDSEGRSVLSSMLRDARNQGRTAIVASHDVAFLLDNCTRILALDGGEVQHDVMIEG